MIRQRMMEEVLKTEKEMIMLAWIIRVCCIFENIFFMYNKYYFVPGTTELSMRDKDGDRDVQMANE